MSERTEPIEMSESRKGEATMSDTAGTVEKVMGKAIGKRRMRDEGNAGKVAHAGDGTREYLTPKHKKF
ncbi:hypothetical protein [Nocardiopsis lambiniae]|uniref:CsbD family protein n=1 Tax=Nocardiopsis lambiniae TaxID=3075539 RepID=A0ABU2M776_9ACTN|nr:hypothetical protein [Nocardiopsis sp. DSM 44743]MDT0328449.1 hypothetical protein [Nocardiopsis sp. DSM 44743]